LWINCGKAEKKMEGTRIKKPYYYFPPLSKRFSFGAIPLASIDELTHSFNERLKMNIDIENEFDQIHVLSSEDDNSLDQAEIIKENNDIDRELADKIT
ncbi:3327_t:CDS:2, partial [Diversispora eburnea]